MPLFQTAYYLKLLFGVYMSYSFTEKKRIRKSFAKRENVLDVPFLLATQIDSYAKFLQLENAFDQRTDDGLQAAFNSIFPIVSHNGYARLEFVHYTLGELCSIFLMSIARYYLRGSIACSYPFGDFG